MPRFGDPCAHGGDQDALAQEVGDQPPDHKDQRRDKKSLEKLNHDPRGGRRPWERQGVDAHRSEYRKEPPESQEPKDLRGGTANPGPDQDGCEPPGVATAVKIQGACEPRQDRAGYPTQERPKGQEGQHGKEIGKEGRNSDAHVTSCGPDKVLPQVSHWDHLHSILSRAGVWSLRRPGLISQFAPPPPLRSPPTSQGQTRRCGRGTAGSTTGAGGPGGGLSGDGPKQSDTPPLPRASQLSESHCSALRPPRGEPPSGAEAESSPIA